jgi:riboflavin biosynthesis pyrimidine reductase
MESKWDDLPVSAERPYVLVNVAATVDGKLDSVEWRGARISSPQDWERVDRRRPEAGAAAGVNGTRLPLVCAL